MTRIIIQRCVNLEPEDCRIVREYAEEPGLGGNDFSAALRILIREWAEMRKIANRIQPEPD